MTTETAWIDRTHEEPLEPDLVQGRDVTAAHSELVERLKERLRHHP